MTDRHAGYVVVLDDSLREDDAQATLNALRSTIDAHTPVEAVRAHRRERRRR